MTHAIEVRRSLRLLNDFFSPLGVEFWLEAGTALAAHRDGKIFEWEHDIDVAIWRDCLPDVVVIEQFFNAHGYSVVVQKGFPYIDNIIQLKVGDSSPNSALDIDIYLYTRQGESAFMRWIHKPEGVLAGLRKRVLFILRNLVSPRNRKWRTVSGLLPFVVRMLFFKVHLYFHIQLSSCIYHRFPKRYFEELKTIDFYGESVKLPKEIDDFLAHRYGPNWATPDRVFNQTGKWRNSKARTLLPMRILPLPEFRR